MVIKVGTFRSYEDRIEDIQVQAAYWVAREHDSGLREAERMELREWLAASPAHELEYMLADNLYADEDLLAALAQAPQTVRQGARNPMVHAINHLHQALAGTARQIPNALAWPRLVAATACLVLAFLATAQLMPQRDPATPVEDPRLAAGMPLATVPGERLISQLPDGSQIELGGGSTATVRFEPGERHFNLEKGDAHFAIGHDPERPFLIETQRARVKVIGTRFLISQLSDFMRIDVYDGTVEIRTGPDDASVMRVHKGSRVTIGRDVRIERFDLHAESDWRQGWIDEEAITLGELAEMVERRTGVRIAVQSDLSGLSISGRFRITQPGQLLHNLGNSYGFEVNSGINTFILSKKD